MKVIIELTVEQLKKYLEEGGERQYFVGDNPYLYISSGSYLHKEDCKECIKLKNKPGRICFNDSFQADNMGTQFKVLKIEP